MQEKNNPLSPHLQIYRWQISSLLSITHRIVGVINILAISTSEIKLSVIINEVDTLKAVKKLHTIFDLD